MITLFTSFLFVCLFTIDFHKMWNLKMHRASKPDCFNRTCKWVFKNHYKAWFKSKLFWVERVASIINDQKNLINMKLVWNFCWSSDKKLFESFFKINNLKVWKFGQIFVQNLAWKWNCKIQKLKIEREYLIFILFYSFAPNYFEILAFFCTFELRRP